MWYSKSYCPILLCWPNDLTLCNTALCCNEIGRNRTNGQHVVTNICYILLLQWRAKRPFCQKLHEDSFGVISRGENGAKLLRYKTSLPFPFRSEDVKRALLIAWPNSPPEKGRKEELNKLGRRRRKRKVHRYPLGKLAKKFTLFPRS